MRRVVACVAAAATVACTDEPRQISNSMVGAFEAALTIAASGPVAAWYDTRDGNGEIYVRRLTADGEPEGDEWRLTDTADESYEASIDALGDMLAVAWYDKANDGTLTARFGLWRQDGRREWTVDLPLHTRNPVLRVNGSGIALAWIQKQPDGAEQVHFGRWNLRGRPLHEPRIVGPAHQTTWNLNMAVDEAGTSWIVFDARQGTRASELFLARADAYSMELRRLTSDDGRESKYPDIGLSGSRVALTWYDERDGNTEVYLLAADANDLEGDVDRRARRVTETPAESIGAYVSWNGDRIGLAWSDAAEGQHEVYFQPFDAEARPLATARRVTTNRTSSLIPAIEPWNDGFALAWSEYVPGGEAHGGTSEIAFALVQ